MGDRRIRGMTILGTLATGLFAGIALDSGDAISFGFAVALALLSLIGAAEDLVR